mgnify:CR=1 FL=1
MIRRQIERAVAFEAGEFWPAVVSAVYFFCLLFGYFMLRPLRDAMGLDGGVDSLRILFLVTLGVMVVANIIFGTVASRLSRRLFVPLVYWFAIACLGVFLAIFIVRGEHPHPMVGKVFYVWLSVFNLFAVTVFWGFMADIFSQGQGKRLFGFIGVGGTAGAICGSAFTGVLAKHIGVVGLFASAIVLIALAAIIATILGSIIERQNNAQMIDGILPPGAQERSSLPIGGPGWSGIRDVLRSPYLLGIGAYVCFFTILSTLLYFERARIIEAFTEDRNARAALMAWIEFAGQTATILIQIFLTGRMLRRFGVGSLLAIVPVVTFIGFLGLLAAPALLLLGVFEAARRAANHALSKPARETLFTVLPREDKYKAKSFIDTFVYRAGDTVGTLADKSVAAIGVSVGWIALPLSAIAFVISLGLGRAEARRAARDHKHTYETTVPDAPTPPTPHAAPAAQAVGAGGV